MPKKKKAGKNAKNKGTNVEKRKLQEADMEGQVYGFIEKAVGGSFFTVKCVDNTERRCKVRTKRMRIAAGDCVIIALRDFDDGGDIIYRYDSDEVRQLQRNGELPDNNAVNTLKGVEEEEEDTDVFVFEDI